MSLMYMVQLKYTKDALMAIIDQQQDRMAAAEALCESIGGKLHGMWGVIGQDHHMFAIVEAPSEVAYMSAYMKLMKSGAFESLKTVKLYSTAQVAEAASMVAGIPYTSATG